MMNDHRLYLQIQPAAQVIPEIAQYALIPGLVKSPVARDDLHATIGTLGRFEATPWPLITDIQRRLSGVALPSFRMIVDLLAGGQKSALLLASERLAGFEHLQSQLADLLRDAIAFLGLDTHLWRRDIKPHVTLGYRGRPSPTQAIDPISWTADRLRLVESLHGTGQHIIHDSWPLTRVRQLGFAFDDGR